jgi:hypothetical protein
MWPADHVDGRPAIHLFQTDFVEKVEAPICPYKAPLRLKIEHTPHFGDSTCKAPILSVVAIHSLVGRVVRL